MIRITVASEHRPIHVLTLCVEVKETVSIRIGTIDSSVHFKKAEMYMEIITERHSVLLVHMLSPLHARQFLLIVHFTLYTVTLCYAKKWAALARE